MGADGIKVCELWAETGASALNKMPLPLVDPLAEHLCVGAVLGHLLTPFSGLCVTKPT